jgi:hypothetical protein
MKFLWPILEAALWIVPHIALATVIESGVNTGVIVVEPPAVSVPVFKNDTDKMVNVALTVNPAGSATCNVQANQDEPPMPVSAGTEGAVLAAVRPGNSVMVQAAGVSGSCKWTITSVASAP